jgi:signal transduction histidine kinase
MTPTTDSTQSSSGAAAPPEPIFEVMFRPKNMLPRLLPEYAVDGFPATIGRHPTNDIELPFDSVSRFHARVEVHDGALRIVDLKSSNGTFVNGRRVQIAPLVDQDLVTFGSIEMSFSRQSEPMAPGAAAPISARTAVRFVAEDREIVQSVIEADLVQSTSRISSIEEQVTSAEHLRRAKDRLITFYRLHEILRSSESEKKMLRSVLSLLFQVLPVDRGVILIRDPRDPNLFNPAAVRVRTGQKSAAAIGISKTILKKCLKDRIAVLTKDATSDRRFEEAESIVAHQIHSAMCVPLISQQHILGFIHLDTSTAVRSFGNDDLAFLANVGVELAIHLHNLHMIEEKIASERMAAIGQTITGLAHNIKNVLLLTHGGMDLMAKRLEEKSYDALEETWGVVKRGIDRINHMVKDMLDYARARQVEKTRCQVNELLTEIRGTFAEEIEQRGVECKLELDPKCPPINIDASGLDKSVVNLLLNAIEATPEGAGKIVLRTRFQPDGSLAIEVEDNGMGIPAEVMRRIFIPFFTTKGSQGNGLGLATTKKFVEDMGGRIEVKSEEGRGACFRITLLPDQREIRLEDIRPAKAEGE